MTRVRATGSMAVLATRNISDSPLVLVHQSEKGHYHAFRA
jgi:hypothetical protein